MCAVCTNYLILLCCLWSGKTEEKGGRERAGIRSSNAGPLPDKRNDSVNVMSSQDLQQPVTARNSSYSSLGAIKRYVNKIPFFR